jgi:hypothetical protein
VDLKYVGRILLDVKEGGLKPITGQSHRSLDFRGKFLPTSLVHKVLFCANTVLCIFETLDNRKFSTHIWIQHKKYCWVHIFKVMGRER